WRWTWPERPRRPARRPPEQPCRRADPGPGVGLALPPPWRSILMNMRSAPDLPVREDAPSRSRPISLSVLEQALREQWSLGQQIMLCWRATPRGVSLLAVPHDYLGHLARAEQGSDRADRLTLLNARFVSRLIAGPR